MTGSIPNEYFDRLYADNPDPWRFATSPYERDKYDDTIAALEGRKFAAGFEAGCSIGILTNRLAPLSDRLLAVDVAPAALAAAKQNCADHTNITFERRRIPDQWPAGPFDLIILSEVLYYLEESDIRLTAAHTQESLRPGGMVVLVHYTEPTDYPVSGNTAAEIFIDACAGRLHADLSLIRQQYRLDRLREGK